MSLVLYAAPMSSATPVLHAVEELGLDCEIVMLDLKAGDQRKPEFLALNPNGKVPTLVVDGTPLFESVAILQWLGARHGVARGLWPAEDAPERLLALSWTSWAYVTCGAAIQRLNFARSPMVDASLHHAPSAADALKQLDRLLALLDARLAGRTWLLGEHYTLADVAVASMVTYGSYCGVPLDGHADVQAWLARFQARPAFAKVWSAPANEA